MKKIQLFSGVLLVAAFAIFSSCQKDQVKRSVKEAVTDITDTSLTGNSDKPRVLVVNALGGQAGDVLDIHINGNVFVNDLGIQEVSQYADLDAGELQVDALNQNGEVLVTSHFNFLKENFYTIVLGYGPDGVTPVISILGLDLLTFRGADSFAGLLNLPGSPTELSGLNFLNLSQGLPTDNLLLGADFLNGFGQLVPGLLALDQGELSSVLFGNGDVLSNLNVLNSTLSLEQLLGDLQQNNSGLSILDLNGVFGLTNFNGIDGLLDLVGSLLADLLGLNSNPLTLVDGSVLNTNSLIPGHDYTMILFGDRGNLQSILIDQTLAGLVPQ